MKIKYKDNPEAGPGNGILVFSEVLAPLAPWSVSIQRASDQKYMTGKKNKWLGEAYFIPLEGEADANGNLSLRLGPAIVDSLDQQEQYKVTLKGGDGTPVTGRLKITAITYSPAEILNNTATVRDDTSEETQVDPAPKPAPEPPKPEPVQQPLVMEQSAPQTQEKAEEKRKWGVMAYAIIGLLILLCFVWWYFLPKPYEHNTSEEPRSIRIEDAPANTSPSPAPAPAPAPALSAEEQVNKFFSNSGATAEAALELAEKLPKNTSQEQDAVYRLYYYAFEQNDPAASLLYGACIDPSKPQWGTIHKNANEAFTAYSKALKLHTKEAEAALQNLRSWLETEIQNGNAQARVWLQQIHK